MVAIPLTRGLVTEVDDETFAAWGAVNWHALRVSDHHYYAHNKLRGMLHRLIVDCPRGLFVDHIDGDSLNNRRENLRVCTHAENMRNRRRRHPSPNRPFKGVSARPNGRFRARICDINLGTFGTAEEAARVWDAAAVLRYGPYAHTNFPVQDLSPGEGISGPLFLPQEGFQTSPNFLGGIGRDADTADS